MINKDSKIYVAGHNGMVGSSVFKALQKEGFVNIIGMTPFWDKYYVMMGALLPIVLNNYNRKQNTTTN